jgi:hypothetical protein
MSGVSIRSIEFSMCWQELSAQENQDPISIDDRWRLCVSAETVFIDRNVMAIYVVDGDKLS